MVEGKTPYAFRSRGIGSKRGRGILNWSDKTVLSDAIKVNQIGYLPDQAHSIGSMLEKWMGTGGMLLDPKIDEFSVINLDTSEVAHKGRARLRHRAGQKNEGAYKQDFSGENAHGLISQA